MENCIKRFPIVGVMIFKNLDNKSLTKSKEANPKIAEFLENERYYWIRKITTYNRKFKGFEESWKEVINKTKIDVIKQLFVAAEHFLLFW